MKVVIAGGSGFLGRALDEALRGAGHRVTVLSRRARAGASVWTPDGSLGPWASAIDGADAVVNLAGESIASGRWSASRKDRILQSRVLATRSVVAAIRSARRPPAVLVNASAQGYYGDHGDLEVTENTAPGNDFMAEVCRRWEAEAHEADAFCRIVVLRTGLALSAAEGALPRMALPFRAFGGGPVGSGRQFVSWIHWADWVALATWALERDGLAGAVNACAPTPVRNREFSAALGHALRRPSWLPAPAFALRVALGEMADALLLTSIRMVPARALAQGFRFRHAELPSALAQLLR
jgi:uncharacterized protein